MKYSYSLVLADAETSALCWGEPDHMYRTSCTSVGFFPTSDALFPVPEASSSTCRLSCQGFCPIVPTNPHSAVLLMVPPADGGFTGWCPLAVHSSCAQLNPVVTRRTRNLCTLLLLLNPDMPNLSKVCFVEFLLQFMKGHCYNAV